MRWGQTGVNLAQLPGFLRPHPTTDELTTLPPPKPPPSNPQRVAPEWEHLGVMGPLIRGVVGDTLLVTFKNMLPAGSHAVSMHPHGVLYDKNSEGSPYADGLPRE
jgi:hypothetical protein